jgi:purine-binding chemotaxis protein CheW
VSDSPLAAAPPIEGAREDSVAAPVVEAQTDAIVVVLGSGRFAVDLALVAEVGRAPAVTRVPGLPVWLAGVANWRGRILPVIDLRTLLGAEAAPFDERGRLLVLSDGNVVVGMLADAVDGTTMLGGDVAAFPPASGPVGSALLSGQVPRDDGPIAVLDVSAILRLRDQIPRGRRSA